MMSKFIDRDEELATLEQEYRRDGSSLVVLYGRRRVGKTTLISQFCQGKNTLFFLASEEAEAQNRLLFQKQAADFLQNELLGSTVIDSWDLIFKTIIDAPHKSKPVIVIDEFQYLGKSNPAFPSIFQRIWDTLLKDASVMVILCGSLISMMESQALAYNSPLYGRRTAQIRLRQIPFSYYHEFYPDLNERELVERYAITGGVPKYIELFANERDIYQAIAGCVLNRSGYLYDEPHFLLQQEVTEIGSYFSLIRVIAAGNHKLSEIASALGVKSTGLTKYLKTLIDLDILERETPVTEEQPEKSKRGLYRITDNYIRFWFAFVYPNRSFLERGNQQIVLDKLRKGFTSQQAAFVYEDVCRAKLWQMNTENRWPFHFSQAGRYWDNHLEIHVAAIDPEENNLILGECKFWQEPMGVNVLRDLEAKATQIPWRKGQRQLWYVLFSISGFTPELTTLAAGRSDLLLIE